MPSDSIQSLTKPKSWPGDSMVEASADQTDAASSMRRQSTTERPPKEAPGACGRSGANNSAVVMSWVPAGIWPEVAAGDDEGAGHARGGASLHEVRKLRTVNAASPEALQDREGVEEPVAE